ncbi:hypothetical protein EDD85DRAFT_941540 [Armillaria nabsnona]|nr:hypothetical protein EDD85DRAFT_941540 [Armillaria nabsnona]
MVLDPLVPLAAQEVFPVFGFVVRVLAHVVPGMIFGGQRHRIPLVRGAQSLLPQHQNVSKSEGIDLRRGDSSISIRESRIRVPDSPPFHEAKSYWKSADIVMSLYFLFERQTTVKDFFELRASLSRYQKIKQTPSTDVVSNPVARYQPRFMRPPQWTKTSIWVVLRRTLTTFVSKQPVLYSTNIASQAFQQRETENAAPNATLRQLRRSLSLLSTPTAEKDNGFTHFRSSSIMSTASRFVCAIQYKIQPMDTQNV